MAHFGTTLPRITAKMLESQCSTVVLTLSGVNPAGDTSPSKIKLRGTVMHYPPPKLAISVVNKSRCLIKIDESMAHIDSIRGLLTLIVSARLKTVFVLFGVRCVRQKTLLMVHQQLTSLIQPIDLYLAKIYGFTDFSFGLMFTKYEFTVKQ